MIVVFGYPQLSWLADWNLTMQTKDISKQWLCIQQVLGILGIVSSPSITILFFVLILFSACDRSEQVKIPSEDELKLDLGSPAFYRVPKVIPVSIHGRWEVRNIFMYSGELKIKRDGSFDFREKGCVRIQYSSGIWRGIGDIYVLQSDDPYFNDRGEFYNRDSGYRHFNNEQLRLVGDTLYGSVSKFVMVEQY
jgi:hypothetical protein